MISSRAFPGHAEKSESIQPGSLPAGQPKGPWLGFIRESSPVSFPFRLPGGQACFLHGLSIVAPAALLPMAGQTGRRGRVGDWTVHSFRKLENPSSRVFAGSFISLAGHVEHKQFWKMVIGSLSVANVPVPHFPPTRMKLAMSSLETLSLRAQLLKRFNKRPCFQGTTFFAESPRALNWL